MKKHTKVFLVVITLMAAGMGWHYFTGGTVNFTPKDAGGSAIDAVKENDKSQPTPTNRPPTAVDLTTTPVDLESNAVKTLIQNADYRKLILNDKFRSVLENEMFVEFARSNEFYTFFELPLFTELEKSSKFSALAKDEKFNDLVVNPAFVDLMKNKTLTAIIRSGQFPELEKLTLKSFE